MVTSKYGDAQVVQRNNMTKKNRQDTIDCIDIEYACVPVFSRVADLNCEGELLRSLLDISAVWSQDCCGVHTTLEMTLGIVDGSYIVADERLQLT